MFRELQGLLLPSIFTMTQQALCLIISVLIELIMNVEIKTLKSFDSPEFTLVCGLPGVAYIGKMAVDYLIQQLKAEKIAEIYSKYFFSRVLSQCHH